MKGIDSGDCVFFPSSCEAGSPTHTHKVDLSVGHCPYLSPSFQKSKSKAPQTGRIFVTGKLEIPFLKPLLPVAGRQEGTRAFQKVETQNRVVVELGWSVSDAFVAEIYLRREAAAVSFEQ